MKAFHSSVILGHFRVLQRERQSPRNLSAGSHAFLLEEKTHLTQESMFQPVRLAHCGTMI